MLSLVAALSRCALALNPSLDISQYAHTPWKIRDGYFKDGVWSIAQPPDGYLWLGTPTGLVRFDGVRPTTWQPPAGQRLPNDYITNLLVARDGRLWIGTRAGLASWKDGQLTHYPEVTGQIGTLLEDREGTLWAPSYGPDRSKLCAIRSGAGRCFGENGGFGQGVTALYEDRSGNLWVGGLASLWRWKPGSPKLYKLPDPELSAHCLIEDDDGALLIGLRSGIRRFVNGKTEALPLPMKQGDPVSFLRDRDGGLWIGTEAGLLHIHHGRTDHFGQLDGLSGDSVAGLFEDREGNIWVSTLDGGLDRFRDFAVTTMTVRQGLSAQPVSFLGAGDGSVWLATNNGGVDRWRDGQMTNYRKQNSGLPDDYVEYVFQDDRGRIWVFTLRGDAYFENGRFVPVSGVPNRYIRAVAADPDGSLWISHDQALFHMVEGRVAERIPWSNLGNKSWANSLIHDAALGGLWLGFFEGGVAFFKDGQVRASYGTADGLGGGIVGSFWLDRDRTLWAATQGGLSRLKDGRIATMTSRIGLPCDAIHWVMEDDAHAFWASTACGLVRIERPELDAWATRQKQTLKITVLDSSDGFISPPLASRVTKATDGKLWFMTVGGVSVVDPRHLPFNKLPPPVYIERVVADQKLVTGRRLPALTRDLQIDYTALSFVAPEKNRFKYKLEGYDRGWQDVGNRRQAFYTNLPPRKYRFRVIASNNRGVWNETGDTLEFSIAAAYYQTTWFLAACVAAFLAMLCGLYQLRLYQIRREFNAQLDGRVGERLRVARELHDTLLQSFQASVIVMQAARNMFARRPEQAAESLDDAITTAAGAIAEGRNAIQNLRAQPAGGGDLAQLLTSAGQELAHSGEAQGKPPVFRLTVEGERRDLQPLLQDEIYRIARELLRNAFRHAQAEQIEAEIRYESSQFRLHVRDDGKGIDPEIVKAGGRVGHWGLPGMRERVDRLGGKLEFWSEAGAGTEAVLTVPAAAAYGASIGGPFSFLRREKADS